MSKMKPNLIIGLFLIFPLIARCDEAKNVFAAIDATIEEQFAEGALQTLRQGDGVQTQAFAPVLGMGHPAHEFMAATQEFSTAGRTPCATVILSQEQTFFL